MSAIGRVSLLLVAGAAWVLGGCLREIVRDEPPPSPSPPPVVRGIDLRLAGLRRLAVIEALDRTDRDAGLPVADSLHERLLGAGVDLHPVVLRRPGAGLAASWLAAQARLHAVDGFVTGAVSAYAIQEGRRRAFVALTAVLLDPAGRILWSRRLSAQAPLGTQQAAFASEGFSGNNGDALAVAVRIAAKEFADDLAPVPAP
ncbi:MAG: hypothetical protein FJZ01_11580 [Candidatus Sericytochromatia bacterium]|nr:hypothetical protein [Candidatus Tanganyikabacteria bacterium]